MAERAESIALRTDFGLLIDGELEQSDEHLDVINPALGEVFARCPAATRAHLERAIAAARAAFPAWRDKSFAERAALIKKMSQRLREKQQELAELLTREQGKPLAQSVAEIDRGAAQSDGMVGIEIPVEVLADDKDKHIELRYRPLGVVGIITPWNAPVSLALGPLVSALYTGQHRDPETFALHAARDAQGRRAAARHLPGRRRERACGRRRSRRLDHGARRGRQDLVHGLGRDRQEGARERRRDAQARDARARRQRSRDRDGRRRPEGRREEDLLRVVREQRPGVHGDQAHLCAREDLLRALRRARRRGEEGEGRRRPRSPDRARPDPEQDAVRQGRRNHRGHEEDAARSSSPAETFRKGPATSCRRRS